MNEVVAPEEEENINMNIYILLGITFTGCFPVTAILIVSNPHSACYINSAASHKYINCVCCINSAILSQVCHM
jgi:hypothetical protein